MDANPTDNLTILRWGGAKEGFSITYEKEKLKSHIEFNEINVTSDGATFFLSDNVQQVARWTDSGVSSNLMVYSNGDTQTQFDLSDKDAKALTKALKEINEGNI